MKVFRVCDTSRSRGRWRPRGRTWTAVGVVVMLLSSLGWRASSATAATAPPDALIVWDDYSTSLLAGQGQLGDVTNAMVSVAKYDAVNAISGTPYEPYLATPAATGTESVDAAVATSTYDLLACSGRPGPRRSPAPSTPWTSTR
jgi:hypothetical protein